MNCWNTFWALTGALYCLTALPASADFRCETRVGYTVELATPKPPSTPPPADSKAPTQTPVADGRDMTIYLELIEARDADEAKTKSALLKNSARPLERARETCRERHENVGGCISSKFENSATTLRSLSFSARKALEDALRADCETQRGRCKKVDSTEPVCAEIVVPTPTPAAEVKDEKKKKK